MKKTQVIIKDCQSYDEAELYKVLSEIDIPIASGQKILVKPNILSTKDSNSPVNTHPLFVKTVVKILLEKGCDVWVGDGPGAGNKKILEVYEASGIKQAVEEAGGKLLIFNDVLKINLTKDSSYFLKELILYKEIKNFDAIISLPKFKTHGLMTFTGAVKNLFGLAAGLSKVEYHKQHPLAKDFSNVLVDIYQYVKPVYSIVDAIIGMDGAGPAGGSPKHIGKILAGADGVAIDAISAVMIGVNPLDIFTTKDAYARGLGEADLQKIDVVGKLEKIPDFELPRRSMLIFDRLPLWLAKLAIKLVWMRPKIINDICKKCGKCKHGCPVSAINIINKNFVIDKKKCIKCLCCHEFCPYNAIEVEKSPLLRLAGMLRKV